MSIILSGLIDRISLITCSLSFKKENKFFKTSQKPNTANFLIETNEESPCSCMRGPPIPKKETLEFKVFIFRINWAPCKSPEASPAIK